ncbi:MAG TPA: hypothetical protein DCW29_25035, partial [Janthinobacterium sp.]|nr:hypothetical protein [Janthinobacterium sp.]
SGYGVLLLSFGFYIHAWLAILIAAAMLVSALSALLLIPALILTFRPRFIFKAERARAPLAVPASLAVLALAVGLSLQAPRAHAASEPDLTAIMARNALAS